MSGASEIGMNSLETLRVFLGWCTATNIGMLLFASIMLVLPRGPVTKIHFSLVPCIALRIMA